MSTIMWKLNSFLNARFPRTLTILQNFTFAEWFSVLFLLGVAIDKF
jgi:hypothetical protein